MERCLVLLVSLGLAVPALATAEAAGSGRAERTVRGSYGAYPTPVTGCNALLGPWSCLSVRVRAGERFFTARVADTHGQPVLVNVYSAGSHVTAFCGRMSRPVEVGAGATLEFDVGQGRAPFTPLPCPERAVKTTGTLTVTLSDRR